MSEEVVIRDRTLYGVLYGPWIARGEMPNHEFCAHGTCIHCGVDAEEWDIECDPPTFTAACEFCLEERLGNGTVKPA